MCNVFCHSRPVQGLLSSESHGGGALVCRVECVKHPCFQLFWNRDSVPHENYPIPLSIPLNLQYGCKCLGSSGFVSGKLEMSLMMLSLVVVMTGGETMLDKVSSGHVSVQIRNPASLLTDSSFSSLIPYLERASVPPRS